MDHAIDRVPGRLAPLGLLGDARLTRLASRGDEGAFSAIFRRYNQPLYRYCRAITGNDEDAGDALQNTMIKAMRALPGEQRSIELKPWLFRVAHNEAVSVLRQRRPQAPLEESADAAIDGPEAGISEREEMRELMDDLHDLPGRQRAAVILRELNGLSYADIAAVFGTSTVAAKQAAYDGRLALQEYAQGRAMDCRTATRMISDGDRQLLRGRKLRGHLRSCSDCTTFKEALQTRRAQLAAIAPAMPATAMLALMQKLFGGGGSAGGGMIGTSAAAGKLAASAGAFKGAAVVAAVAVGAGAAGVSGARIAAGDAGQRPTPEVRAAEADPRGVQGRSAAARTSAADAAREAAGRTATRKSAPHERVRRDAHKKARRRHRRGARRAHRTARAPRARRNAGRRRRPASPRRPVAPRRAAPVRRVAAKPSPVTQVKPRQSPAPPPAAAPVEPAAPVAPAPAPIPGKDTRPLKKQLATPSR